LKNIFQCRLNLIFVEKKIFCLILKLHFRFHRSAGIVTDGRNSPVMTESLQSSQIVLPYSNPCVAPVPHSIIVHSLCQIRSQSNKLKPDETGITTYIRVSTCFSHGRVLDTAMIREMSNINYNPKKNIADSLYVMTSNGILTQYDMYPMHSNGKQKCSSMLFFSFTNCNKFIV